MGVQDFGENFNLHKLLRARDVARDMTYELASLIRPGMVEKDAHELYKALSKKQGIEKQWHPPKLRFGPNTVKNFSEPSEEYVLQEEDIFFIDIGPIVDGHEADYGETFTIGSQFEHKHVAQASKKIFDEVVEHWKKTKLTGMPLYEFAQKRARLTGHTLSMNSDGHRIGDFPHHVFFKGGLAECEESVVPNAWILEIHLLGPQNKYGAFFEDILTDEI
jgi:methionine aminopeptidase